MANDKYYGYSPKPKKGSIGVPYGNDNRLDRYNPYEFRKGMDYELSTMGISRLNESTPDQRQVSTEKVLKNLSTLSVDCCRSTGVDSFNLEIPKVDNS